jgi:heptosyltransferase-2
LVKDRTLIIGPSWVGDMVMAQSLFKAIKEQHPETTIDVLAPEWSRPLTERMPEIAQSIAMPIKHGELSFGIRRKLGLKLREEGYQRCYVLPNSFKSALIPRFANIPKRIGWRGEWRYPLLNDVRVLNKKTWPLMVQRYVALAFDKQTPVPYQPFRPKLVAKAENIEAALARYQLNRNQPIMVLCPGAEFGPSKRWPENYYAELANAYLAKNWQVWIFGSAKDSEVAKLIQAQTIRPCHDLTGKTSLADAIDLMSLANMVVSNDSGLMHIAAALDRPLVAVYGSTDPGFTPPLNDKVTIVQEKMACSPCFKRECPLKHHDCMRKLSVQKVIDAVDAQVDS